MNKVKENLEFKRSYTSEAVSAGHPDKLADQISDAILDLYLAADPLARVACETLVTTDKIIVAGEITSVAPIGVDQREHAARKVVYDLGYTDFGFDPFSVKYVDLIHEQSPDIAQCVTSNVVAGDQGIMFGYATNESPDYMPLALSIARNVLKQLQMFKSPLLGPDAKSMVTVLEFKNAKPIVSQILVSTQHIETATYGQIENLVQKAVELTMQDYKDYLHTTEVGRVVVNPSGKFVLGGPAADTGLTGRKIIVDTYGGVCPHGGGAFSGKDPSKVDRSAAYYARWIAKNMVANDLCDKVLVSLSYIIGSDVPFSVGLDTYGTNKTMFSDADLVLELFPHIFDSRTSVFVPKLRKPIYSETAKNGHFGINENIYKAYLDGKGDLQTALTYPWETTFSFKIGSSAVDLPE